MVPCMRIIISVMFRVKSLKKDLRKNCSSSMTGANLLMLSTSKNVLHGILT